MSEEYCAEWFWHFTRPQLKIKSCGFLLQQVFVNITVVLCLYYLKYVYSSWNWAMRCKLSHELCCSIPLQPYGPRDRYQELTDVLGFSCLESAIQDHLGYRHPRQLCWKCQFTRLMVYLLDFLKIPPPNSPKHTKHKTNQKTMARLFLVKKKSESGLILHVLPWSHEAWWPQCIPRDSFAWLNCHSTS